MRHATPADTAATYTGTTNGMERSGLWSDEAVRTLRRAIDEHDPARIVTLDEAWRIGATIQFRVPVLLYGRDELHLGCNKISIVEAFYPGALRALITNEETCDEGPDYAVFRFLIDPYDPKDPEEADGIIRAPIGLGGADVELTKEQLAGDGWDGMASDVRIIIPAPVSEEDVPIVLSANEARYILSLERTEQDSRSKAIIRKVRDAGKDLGPITPHPNLKLTVLFLRDDEASRLRDVFAGLVPEGTDAGARLLRKIRKLPPVEPEPAPDVTLALSSAEFARLLVASRDSLIGESYPGEPGNTLRAKLWATEETLAKRTQE